MFKSINSKCYEEYTISSGSSITVMFEKNSAGFAIASDAYNEGCGVLFFLCNSAGAVYTNKSGLSSISVESINEGITITNGSRAACILLLFNSSI